MTVLYIHAGTHKTASTTIQHALRSAAPLAGEAEGWMVLPRPIAAHGFMAADDHDEDLVQQFQSQLESSIRDIESSHRSTRFVLSFEGLSGSTMLGYLNSEVVASMLRDATSRYEVKVIVYLRRQDEWLESMYTQSIHEGGACGFDEFKARFETPGALDYHRFLEGFRTCFGDDGLIVRSYHAASDWGIVADFADIIGSTALRNARSESRLNPSYSRPALEIARRANPNLAPDQRRSLRKALQRVMPKPKGGSFGLLSASERDAFLARYSNSNRMVADRYFGGDVRRMFPPPTSPQSSHTPDPTVCEGVANLVVHLFSMWSREIERVRHAEDPSSLGQPNAPLSPASMVIH